MSCVAIIADDLTGANDSGVEFVKKGFRTSVLFDHRVIAELLTSRDALVLDTSSRSFSKHKAYETVREVAEALKKAGATDVVKKMDSTLRGPFVQETQAIVEIFSPDWVVIAPAFPRMGRTTRDGVHYVHGEIITETEFSEDPKTPVKHARIADYLQEEGIHPVHFSIDNMKQGQGSFPDKQGTKWVVADAETDQDLSQLVEVFRCKPGKVLWVGSAGLMEHITPLVDTPNAFNKQGRADNVLIVSGSMSQKTYEQVQRVGQHEDVFHITLHPNDVLSGHLTVPFVVDQVQAAFQMGDSVVLAVDASEEAKRQSKILAKQSGVSTREVGAVLENLLSQVTKQIVELVEEVNGLVLTGGDTAKSICGALGVSGVDIVEEVESGLPHGLLVGLQRPVQVVTKAGGFGQEESLVNSLQVLKGGTNHVE